MNLPKLLKTKITKENTAHLGILVILVAIPLTVILLGVRQELRKRAEGVGGSILINNGAEATNSRNVTLTLTPPTQQAFLKVPQVTQAHAAQGTTLYGRICQDTNGDGRCSYDCEQISSNPPEWYCPAGEEPGIVGARVDLYDCWNYTPCRYGGETTYSYDDARPYVKGTYNFVWNPREDEWPLMAPCEIRVTPPRGWECVGSCTNRREHVCQLGPYDFPLRSTSPTIPTPSPTPTPTRVPVPSPTPRPPTLALTVVGVMISNYSNFSGTSEESFVTTKTWTLTEGGGLKTVYAKFKWSDGTWTTPVFDTITLQTAGPTPTPTPTPTTPPGTPTTIPTPTPLSAECEVADLNEDDCLDIFDFVMFLETYGQSGENLPGDLDGDGAVTILDVSIFIDTYQTCVM